MRQLQPLIKTYDWGMPVDRSMAPFFVQVQNQNHDDKIAELWWGHPHVLVKDSLETIPIPYLLKLLFVEKPLSLQVHPTAEQIHEYPSSFTDPLPKPEVVIALTDFEALCGFLLPEQVHERISSIPLLASYPSFQSLFEHVPDMDLLIASTRQYAIQFATEPHCRVFLSLLELYPSGDPAVLCPFYMNHVFLHKGQALVIPASQPHCYLSGQGVECMPPSDNVVRCGLTTKQCNQKFFFQLTYSSSYDIIIKNHPYDHPELNSYFRIFLPNRFCFCRKGSVFLVLDGEGIVEGKTIQKGDSWIVEENKTIFFPDELDVIIAMSE